MKKLSRRVFLKLSGSTAAGVILSTAGCAPGAPDPTNTEPDNTEPVQEQPAATEPTQPPEVEPTDITSAETAPTEAVVAAGDKVYRRPEVIQYYPTVKSRVVRARSDSAWSGDALVPEALREMVDRSITGLTGIADPKAAWQALFQPEERIAIKVNAFRNSRIWTHPALVKAVTDSLVEAGTPAENITIFDFYTTELEEAGFPVNKDGPGVRCIGSDVDYAPSQDLGPTTAQLSNLLLQADALINIPVLKSHMMAGLTFALKNHYGSVSFPDGLHQIPECLPALNKVPAIKDATRLVIGDMLEANTKWSYSYPYWVSDTRGDSIMMSYDPLAHDRVGLDELVRLAEANGNSTTAILGMAEPWLATAAEAGLGTSDLEQIEVVEV